MKRLPSAREIAAITKRGRHAVGHGLYLQVSEWNTRSWIFRYTRDGVQRHMGLGSVEYVTLQQARQKAFELRQELILNGVDPLVSKHEDKRAKLLASTRAKTFKQCALDYIAAHEDSWRGNHSRKQWIESLTNHVFPKIGDMPIGAIDVAAILSVLDPISRQIPETARRIKSRLALVLDWAAARELRPHGNPAKRPNLLPKRKRKAKHFAAMPYPAMPTFMAELRQRQEISAHALEFAILTAARPGEVLGARWSEINSAEAMWTIPGERMKGGKPHRVPLSGRAVELLTALPREGEYCFPGRRTGGKQYVNSLVLLLRRMGHAVTAHGFRASFRTWAGERTNYPREIIEAALAHVVGDAAEQAYARGDMLARRRQLMESWTEYCSRPDDANGVVVPLPSAKVVKLKGRRR
jgi:integrase